MRTHRIWAISLLCVAIPFAAASCGSEGSSGGSGGSGGAGGEGSGLTWYTTCGDPVCGGGGAGGVGPGGEPPCSGSQTEGAACSTENETCWPGGGCGVLLVCAKADPKTQPGGCPISRARYKKDIAYLPESDLRRVHDDLMAMRMATWRYTSEPAAAREHLGFIIDDNPASPAVAASGDQVDLYGYTSMAVAAAQVQDKRLDALERELRALREEVGALREKAARCEP
jgi:hypothetical protein